MSPLRFTLRETPPCRIDCAPLIPARLAGLSRGEIEQLTLSEGRHRLAVGDVFKVRGSAGEAIVFEDASDRLDAIGAALDGGSISVEGHVGQQAGRRMRGGTLTIVGDAGPHAGSAMSGGTLVIGGDAGERLAAGLAGEREGMRGGLIHVHGHAGARAGDQLRRGMIIIEGNAGEHLASRMIAGTIAVCGEAGSGAGMLMRRGTLLIGAMSAPAPTFVPTGMLSLAFARLLYRTMLPVSRKAARLATTATLRLMGDAATLGKGEVLVREIA